MGRLGLFIFCVFPLVTLSLAGASPEVPTLPSGEVVKFVTREKSNGNLIQEGEYHYDTSSQGGRTAFRQRGNFKWPSGNRGKEEVLMWQDGAKLTPRRYHIEVSNPAGATIRTLDMAFSADVSSVHIKRTYSDPKGEDDFGVEDAVDKTVQLPPNSFARPMFDALLRVLDLPEGTRQKYHVVTRLGEVMPVILVAEGVESMKTSFGVTPVQRIRLIPDIPVLPSVLPSLNIHLWYTKEAPHLPVKFEGFGEPPPPYMQPEVSLVVTSIQRGVPVAP